MSFSYTNTGTTAFTITHAKHLASKVAADLKRVQRFYNSPSDSFIQQYESELIEFLRNGYLDTVTYGFQKDNNWIAPTLRYTAKDLQGMITGDDDPGRVPANMNVSGAHFTSYMSYSNKYNLLTDAERETFRNTLPFKRAGAPQPGVSGYMSQDKTYSAGGAALERSTIKSY